MKRFMDDVREATYKASEELYKAAQAASGAGQGAQPGLTQSRVALTLQSDDDDVIDADFRTVEEDE